MKTIKIGKYYKKMMQWIDTQETKGVDFQRIGVNFVFIEAHPYETNAQFVKHNLMDGVYYPTREIQDTVTKIINSEL